ncbi:MAG: hypothetical protein IMF06_06945 [Proteobacteria bacterium]|nr:hypothetical protein [Pseudomonadota bacterium]
MNDVFVIRNQLGHYWGKKKLWLDGGDARLVTRFKHRDEAVNTLFELSSKDIELRGEIAAAQLSPRGEPMIEASDIPLPEVPIEKQAAQA